MTSKESSNWEPFEQENDEGPIEYKLKLSPKPNQERIERLASQMIYRLREGNGEAIYELGISDSGEFIGLSEKDFETSVDVLIEIAEISRADITQIRKVNLTNRWIGEFLIRFRPQDRQDLPTDINIAMIGNVDSGKSTLIGTLLTEKLDDGNGRNAVSVARHKHEVESGRTSSVSIRIMGYSSKGDIINHRNPSPTPQEVMLESSKIIRFIDLAGHEKYLKTTIFGLAGYEPDYACVTIDGNRGIQKMTREHIGLALLALRLPIFVILTKSDLAPDHIYKKNLNQLRQLLKSPGLNRIPIIVREIDDVAVVSKKKSSNRLVPIFKVSNVTGEGLNLLKIYFNLLTSSRISRMVISADKSQITHNPFLLFIDEIFNVTGVGKVVSGIVQSGKAKTGDIVLLGPDINGNYVNTRIRSIQNQRIQVDGAFQGDFIALALGFKGTFPKIHKGMVLTTYEPYQAISRFEAEILVLHHPTTMKINYNAQIHLKTIRSQARIIKIHKEKEMLRSGERSVVTFEFLYKPQFILEGMKFVFREGRTKGIGIVKKVL
ncbi:MAG: GTP-binding protein [Candidatus Hodarchaeales archaeon]